MTRAAALLLGLSLAAGALAGQGVGPAADTTGRPAISALDRAIALAAGDTVTPYRAGAMRDTTPEPVVLELRIGRLLQGTIQGYRVRTEALIPLTQFFQMSEVFFRLSPEGRLEAVVDPGRVAIVVDARSDTMRYGHRPVRVEREFKRFEDGELYVGAERLGDLLGIRLAVDWTELSVSVVDPGTLPVARRLDREAARDALGRARHAGAPERSVGRERARWGGTVLDYSLFLPSTSPLESGFYRAGLGADLFGGSLEARVHSVRGLNSPVARWEGSWTGVWRDGRVVKQVTLGDGYTTGPRLRQVQGLVVTNAPYLRPSLVGQYAFGGQLEPGWVVEAYRGGQLVAFDSTDGRGAYGFDLPTHYGENPVDFIGYGPFGEVRQFNRQYRVQTALLPLGRFEYGLAGGACRSTLCDATANVDLRYGLTRLWTVRGGLEQLWRDSVPDLSQPYFGLSGSPAQAIAVDVEGLHRGFVRAAVAIEPSVDLRVGGDVTAYDPTVEGQSLTASGRLREWGVTAFARPIPALVAVYADANARLIETTTSEVLQARLGASLPAGPLRLLPYVRLDRTAHVSGAVFERTFAGVNVFAAPQPSLGPVLGRVWARGDAEVESGVGLRTASATLGRDLARGLRLEVGARYQREVGGVGAVAMLQTYLPGLRSTTSVDASPVGPASANTLIEGSTLYNGARGGWELAPGPSLERAGIAGRVFVDANGNGRRDADEAGLGGVRVRVGSETAVSGPDGWFRAWNLTPFEPVPVAIDSLSLDSPLLVPAFGSAVVVPGPNRYRAFDLPVVAAGVVEGRMVMDGGDGHARGLAGAGLVLTNVRTGARMHAVTFSDGDFYVLGVKPGEYELTVDPRVLDSFGVQAPPVRFTLRAAGDATGISGIELRLTPRS